MGKHTKWNYELVKKYIESFGFHLLSTEYTRSRDKIKIECPKGHKIERRFDHFKRDHSCPKCVGNAKYTYEEVQEYILNIGYELLSTEYINSRTCLKIKCSHGHIFQMRFHDLKNGQRCPKCYHERLSKEMTYTWEFVREKIENEEGYKLLSKEYRSAKNDKLKIQCPKNHEFEMCFGNWQQGQRCSKCKTSKGEKRIEEFLINNDIEYIREYKFADCKYKRCLPFDFYLPQYNCCIEFDGSQHSNAVEHFGGKKRLEDTIIKDGIRDQYCENNGIKLIRIDYSEYDLIDDILNKELIR